MKSIIQGAVLVFLVAGKSFSRGAQFWRKYVIAPFCFLFQEVDAASDDYLRKVHDLSPDKRRAEMERIQKLFKDAKNYGDEKVSIAIQTYEMVDKHIRRLDGDLAKFEAELREKGRLSQTDDSDEDDEEEEERSVGKKGSRKKQGKDKEKDAKYKKQKVRK